MLSSLFLFVYYISLSGDHAKTLEKKTFTDAKKTTYLEAVKYVATLVWTGEILMMIFNFVIFIPQIPRVPDQAGAQPP